MAFDLAISEHGDLLFAGNRDLMGVGGKEQVEQRIRTRLIIPRGTWIYDADRTLGSLLADLSIQKPEEAATRVSAIVREALRPMEELVVDDVQVEIAGTALTMNVIYSYTETVEDIPVLPISGDLSITLPISG